MQAHILYAKLSGGGLGAYSRDKVAPFACKGAGYREANTHTHTYSRRSTVIWSARVFPTNNAQMPLSHSSNFAAKIFLFLRTIYRESGKGGGGANKKEIGKLMIN